MRYIVTHMVKRDNKGMKRDNAITVRLSDEERRALDGIAQDEDVPVAQIIRRAVKREMERVKPSQPNVDSSGE